MAASLERRKSTVRRGSKDMSRKSSGRLQRLLSTDDNEQDKKVTVYENSYQMAPKPEQEFKAHTAQKVLRASMTEIIPPDMTFDDSVGELVARLNRGVREAIKAMTLPRYKIIVHTQCGQLGSHGLITASKWLWDASFDGHASHTWKNDSVFVTTAVYALYLD